MNLLIEPLTRSHDRKGFDCSDDAVNIFLREKAMQDQDLELSRTTVLVQSDSNPKRIIGYFTLAFTEIPQEQIPNDRPRIKRTIPVILLGQIGVDLAFQGRGFGDRLLIEAQSRVFNLSEKIGIRAMVLDSRTETLARWYESRSFFRAPGSLRLIKNINDIRELFR